MTSCGEVAVMVALRTFFIPKHFFRNSVNLQKHLKCYFKHGTFLNIKTSRRLNLKLDPLKREDRCTECLKNSKHVPSKQVQADGQFHLGKSY